MPKLYTTIILLTGCRMQIHTRPRLEYEIAGPGHLFHLSDHRQHREYIEELESHLESCMLLSLYAFYNTLLLTVGQSSVPYAYSTTTWLSLLYFMHYSQYYSTTV